MKLPYIPDPPPPTINTTPSTLSSPSLPTSNSPPRTTEIITRLRTRRSPRPLQPLDLTLLHAPPIADGWNAFLGSIRTQTTLSTTVREMVICRVAALNGAEYEWGHHVGILRGGGLGEEGVRRVRDTRGMGGRERDGDKEEEEAKDKEGEKRRGKGENEGLTEEQWAVVDYTDEMTKNVKVKEEVFQRLKTFFGDREIVEITATVAAYNCVSRFLVALDVGEMNERSDQDRGEGAGID